MKGFDNAENSGLLLINLVEQASASPQQTEIESKFPDYFLPTSIKDISLY
ncbi:MAG: hypothetical protein IPP22_03625 [Nitrosomonas sp.]|nr:hypothetical protein [Nitrosomonas sp.]